MLTDYKFNQLSSELLDKYRMKLILIEPYDLHFAVANDGENLLRFFNETESFNNLDLETIENPHGVTYSLYTRNKYSVNYCIYIKEKAENRDLESTIWHESLHVAMNTLDFVGIDYKEAYESLTYLQCSIARKVKKAYQELRGYNYGYNC